MTATSIIQCYERQQSSDSGWDNPFRPDGDLSREADKIVNMIRGGKPITPTEDTLTIDGKTQNGHLDTDPEVKEKMLKANINQNDSAVNGSYSHQKAPFSDADGQILPNQISKQMVPGPTSASHVIIDEKTKKNGCCSIQ